MKRMVSWNVNGLRAILQKNFMEFFTEIDADIFCLQEIKLQAGQVDLELPGYHMYWNYAVKKGYSGTAIFTKEKPLQVSLGLGIEEHDQEGRVISLEFPEYYLLTVYTPNSQSQLQRLEYRMAWEDAFRNYVKMLDQMKPVIICGDLNVAHQEIDLARPDDNHFSAGFTDEERQKITELLSAGFTDTYRYFYPEETDKYTWWSYRTRARERNVGWRIDYFLCSDRMQERLASAEIRDDVLGSDHCPVLLEIN